MGWLEGHEQRIAKEKAAREAEAERERKFHQDRWNRRDKEGKEWVKHRLEDLVGRQTKFGPLALEHDRCRVTVKGGDEKLASVHFSSREDEKYDRDGCSWGTGVYYDTINLVLSKEWVDGNGVKQQPYNHEYCCEEKLAEYLIHFLEPK